MLRLPIAALATLASTVFALPTNTTGTGRSCGSVLSAPEMAAAEDYFDAHKPGSDMSAFAASLNVYWHVISADNTLKGGNIPDSRIAASLKVLNDDYSGSGLSFTLTGVDRTVNPHWFNTAPQSSQQSAMKQTLRKGGASDLNVYSVGSITDPSTGEPGVLGYATFPSSYLGNPQDDGVVFLYSTVPGGDAAPYNLGRTLTHEVGHWAGEWVYTTPLKITWVSTHKFIKCYVGDYVLDTPSEKSAAFGCQTGRDTCTMPGTDPIHNFMDYSDDACMDKFTSGQMTRMKGQMATYRGVSPL
ncbi:unnamed protein product [Rhizoctonia solani]|uniref:Peptidase M43 pregnancy-associated plasma-A domain-containing protein n=1 Tax=Rhizoctonia solani TaxID=456999 RepID=A0A8H3H822_9AGAM|nr:unnamed protein product [Rhizoctonia solani]